MKKIGFLLGSLAGAGAEKTILTLATRLYELGNEVHLVVLKSAKDYKVVQGLKIHVVTDYAKNENQALIKIANKIGVLDLFVTSRAERYSALNAKQRFCSVHITPTAWLKKRNFLFKWKTLIQILKLKNKFANKNLIALSEGIKKDLVENLGVDSEHVVVINNPFDIEKIQDQASANFEQLDELGDYIVYVAALILRKRHADLFNAFSQMQNKNIKLVLVGKGSLQVSLQALAKQLKIDDRVVFWPWDPNPYRLIKNARLSVLVSEAEGLPRVLIESIIIGTPVVSTDCPSGPNEVLLNENLKYLVPIGDVNKLRLALDDAIANNPLQYFDVKRFDATKVAQSYQDLIDD